MIHKLQLIVITSTTIGVWGNLYLNYLNYKKNNNLETVSHSIKNGKNTS